MRKYYAFFLRTKPSPARLRPNKARVLDSGMDDKSLRLIMLLLPSIAILPLETPSWKSIASYY